MANSGWHNRDGDESGYPFPVKTHGDCWMCADDASAYNHCAFCGKTFATKQELEDHLDEHIY